MAAETLLKQLKSGKSVRDSMAVADAKQVAFEAIASIEVTDKEYLIYNEATKQTIAITGDNYSEQMKPLFAACAAADPDQAESLSKSMKKIQDAITYLNKTCF
jgi:gas vesicle protein